MRKTFLQQPPMSRTGVGLSFGPVPSRRLGKSLGVNNIPAKACTYSCVYCQVGPTSPLSTDRREFYPPQEIYTEVKHRLAQAEQFSERVDYLAFVPDGEPTLDVHLDREIASLRSLGVPVGVITNGSLLWREDVRMALAGADWVSLKIDAARDRTWRRMDRPHPALKLSMVLDGMLSFAETFPGTLVTETMLVKGINDGETEIGLVGDFLHQIEPSAAYLSIPTRPPAERWVLGPDEAVLNRAYQNLAEKVPRVEYLIGDEGNAFAFTGNAEEDLLSITAVHPMKAGAVAELLARAGASWAIVDSLLARGALARADYNGDRFYLRRIAGPKRPPAP